MIVLEATGPDVDAVEIELLGARYFLSEGTPPAHIFRLSGVW